MLKLAKYCKPYLLSIIAILVLIFGQVQAELALPDYMADIVTNGIQYGGITTNIPTAMTSSTMDKVLLLANQQDDQLILDSYDLIKQNDPNYLNDYPTLENEDIYVLKNESTIKTVLPTYLMLVQTLPSFIEETNPIDLPEGMSIWSLLAASPEALSSFQAGLDTKLASYSQDSIDAGATVFIKSEYEALGINTSNYQSTYIFTAGMKMLGIALLGAFAAIIVAYLSSKTAGKVARDIRKGVFEKVESFSNNEFSKFSTSSLITRTTNDVQQVQLVFTMILRIVIYAPMMGIGAIIKVLRYPSMLWILGLALVLILSLLATTFIVALPKFKVIQKLLDRMTLVMREFLDGLLVVRAFNTQKHEEAKFDKANKDITKVNLFVNRTMASVMPLMTFLMSSISILIIWVAAQQIDLGTMQIGEMMAFSQYSIQVLMSFIMVAMISIMLPRSTVSAARIVEVLNTKLSIVDPETPVAIPATNQPITFENVYFKYPNAEEYILSDISFVANPGETIAFIGSTGSGKSTLINLIPRFFDATQGSILYGNQDIRNYTQHDLREKIGYVPQKGVLFSGDIESNLRYADQNATDEMLAKAIEIAQAKEFIDSKEDGIHSAIAQGGTNVSGGQKQRLSIARAITKNPSIYIFDDSFSALDYKTDSNLRAALNRYVQKTNSTVFIVAQRISTILNADRIIVLDKGVMVGQGSHVDLLKTCEVYQEIAYSQLSKEELEHGKQ